MQREKVIEHASDRIITTKQAGALLGLSSRQVRRLKARYRERGRSGLEDGRSTTSKRKRIDLSTLQTMCTLKELRYPDFSVRHFYEFLQEDPAMKSISYSSVLRHLQQNGLVKKASRRGRYRRKRERQPIIGMRVHLDSSTHHWLGPLVPKWDLTVALDDADGRILSGRFSPQEGTMSTLQALWDIFTTYGRFQELYTDRGSHFCCISDETYGPDDFQPTQLARVLKTLAIKHIWAHSPQARGRSERVFGTLQQRLVHELALHRITTYDKATTYLHQVFIPNYNRRFTVKPAHEGSAFTALPHLDLHLLLSVQDTRVVHNDFTIHFNSLRLQLPPSVPPTLAKKTVVVHTFLDGSLGISFEGRLMACFDAQGLRVKVPDGMSPMTHAHQPRPTRPELYYRSLDFTHPDFWAFLTTGQKGAAGHPIVSRNDLFFPNWKDESGHL